MLQTCSFVPWGLGVGLFGGRRQVGGSGFFWLCYRFPNPGFVFDPFCICWVGFIPSCQALDVLSRPGFPNPKSNVVLKRELPPGPFAVFGGRAKKGPQEGTLATPPPQLSSKPKHAEKKTQPQQPQSPRNPQKRPKPPRPPKSPNARKCPQKPQTAPKGGVDSGWHARAGGVKKGQEGAKKGSKKGFFKVGVGQVSTGRGGFGWVGVCATGTTLGLFGGIGCDLGGGVGFNWGRFGGNGGMGGDWGRLIGVQWGDSVIWGALGAIGGAGWRGTAVWRRIAGGMSDWGDLGGDGG